MITVRELIKLLRKCPPDAVVAWRDHDNEFSGFVRTVTVIDEDESPKLVERGIGVVLGP